MVRCSAFFDSGQQCFNNVQGRSQFCPFHFNHRRTRSEAMFSMSPQPAQSNVRSSVIVESTAVRQQRLAQLCNRLGVAPEPSSLRTALMYLPSELMLSAINSIAPEISLEAGTPGSAERKRFSYAVVGVPDLNEELASSVLMLRNKLQVLAACDPQLVAAMSVQAQKWLELPATQLLFIPAAPGVEQKLKALFDDISELFSLTKDAIRLGFVVLLSSNIPNQTWVQAISAIFEDRFDNDVEMQDDSCPSLPSIGIWSSQPASKPSFSKNWQAQSPYQFKSGTSWSAMSAPATPSSFSFGPFHF